MRGPVGSLATPEPLDQYERADAGDGVTVFVHNALVARVEGPDGCRFAFGLFGRCSIVAS